MSKEECKGKEVFFYPPQHSRLLRLLAAVAPARSSLMELLEEAEQQQHRVICIFV